MVVADSGALRARRARAHRRGDHRLCDPARCASAAPVPVPSPLLDEWRRQVAADHLTLAGLLDVRERIDPLTGEFEDGITRALLAAEVDEGLAVVLGTGDRPPAGRW